MRLNGLLLLIFLVATNCMMAQQKPSVFITENGNVSFVSDAPLELIKAGSNELKGAVDLNNQNFLFIIDNASFKGFNSPLQQEHFHENYIESKEFPKTSFKGKIIEKAEWVSGTEQLVRVKGILDLHGVQKERLIKASIVYSENSIKISAAFSVFLEDHAIRIPKVVARKIAPEIQIKVEAQLQPNDDKTDKPANI